MPLQRRRRITVKLSAFYVELSRSQQRGAISRNRNRKRKGINGNLCDVKQNPINNTGIDKLPDDLLINILSRMSFKEAVRTSVLARRWRSLWSFMFGTLEFDHKDPIHEDDHKDPMGDEDEDDDESITLDAWEKFEAWVCSVLELHQGRFIEGMVIRFDGIKRRESRAFDSCVYSAAQKRVERFELHLPFHNGYDFPSLEMIISNSRGSGSPFRSLRTLRLVDVCIKDEVVNYFLASCPNLEQLCIEDSFATNGLLVVDPPSLRVLEISRCYRIQSLDLSATSLVSLAYGGSRNGLLLKKIPNLRELTIMDFLFLSFFSEPEKHSSYIHQLVKLVVDIRFQSRIRPLVAPTALPQLCSLKQLEVKIMTEVGRGLFFFTSLIKASPQLCEFRIEMVYRPYSFDLGLWEIPFPAISGAEAVKFEHKSLKVVEMAGFVGCSSEEELLRALLKHGPLIERVVIDTQSEYYDCPYLALVLTYKSRYDDDRIETGGTTRTQSKHYAQRLVSTLPQHIEFIVT